MLRTISLLLLAASAAPALAEPVRAEPLTARGVVRSEARLELRTDLDAVVTAAPARSGLRFAKGDPLVAFDCRRHRADLAAAHAESEAARIEARSKRRLHRHGAVGRADLDRTAALHRGAGARAKALAIRLASCTLHAPFAGRVVAVSARTGARPRPGEPLVTVVDDRRLRIEIVAPSRWLRWARPGRRFRFRVDETGRTHAARLVGTGAEVDPRTQTVTLHAALDDPDGIVPGMSGDAMFAGEE